MTERRKGDEVCGDDVPVTSGVHDPYQHVCPFSIPDDTPRDSLSLHIARLIALHPAVAERFRGYNLARMGQAAKESLLTAINQMLRIKPFGKNPV